MKFVRQVFVSYFPAEWRQRWPADSPTQGERAAVVSGLLQIFIALNIWWAGMVWYAGLTDKVSPEIWNLKIMWTGSVMMIAGWCAHPVGLASIYFVVEGVGRIAAAAVADEVMGSAPLKLCAVLCGKLFRARVPVFADTMRRSGDNYVVRSSSAKDWGGSVAISVGNRLYFVASHTREGHAYVYTLRPAQEGEVIRGVREYAPSC